MPSVDPPQRLAFCNWVVNYSSQNPGFLNNLVSSDEAVFSLNSEVNTHNVIRYARYGQGHPQDHHIGNRQGADQVLVWVGLTGYGEVFGPHFVRGTWIQGSISL